MTGDIPIIRNMTTGASTAYDLSAHNSVSNTAFGGYVVNTPTDDVEKMKARIESLMNRKGTQTLKWQTPTTKKKKDYKPMKRRLP